MTRSEARDSLRGVHPELLEIALLHELGTGQEVISSAVQLQEILRCTDASLMSARERHVAIRCRIHLLQEMLDDGYPLELSQDDLISLLTSSVPEARTFAMRLLGRDSV
jgi:hypothetical protein